MRNWNDDVLLYHSFCTYIFLDVVFLSIKNCIVQVLLTHTVLSHCRSFVFSLYCIISVHVPLILLWWLYTEVLCSVLCTEFCCGGCILKYCVQCCVQSFVVVAVY